MKKWFGILDEGAREDLLFHSREMAQSSACIELNMFKGKKFIQLLHDVVRDAEGVRDEGEEARMMQNERTMREPAPLHPQLIAWVRLIKTRGIAIRGAPAQGKPRRRVIPW